MSTKSELRVISTQFSQDEILTAVSAECPDFGLIPKADQWVMALYSIGYTPQTIASLVCSGESAIERTIKHWAGMTSQIPDNAKSKLNQRMVWNAIGSYVSVLSDKRRIDDLSPKDAMTVLRGLPDLMRELMKLEEDYVLHTEKMKMSNFDLFKKSLGEGNSE